MLWLKVKERRDINTALWVVILCKMIRKDLSDIVTYELQGSEGLNHHMFWVRNSKEISVTAGNVRDQKRMEWERWQEEILIIQDLVNYFKDLHLILEYDQKPLDDFES